MQYTFFNIFIVQQFSVCFLAFLASISASCMILCNLSIKSFTNWKTFFYLTEPPAVITKCLSTILWDQLGFDQKVVRLNPNHSTEHSLKSKGRTVNKYPKSLGTQRLMHWALFKDSTKSFNASIRLRMVDCRKEMFNLKYL